MEVVCHETSLASAGRGGAEGSVPKRDVLS